MYRFAQQDNFRLVIELVYTLDMAITSNGKVNLKSDFTQATAGKKIALENGFEVWYTQYFSAEFAAVSVLNLRKGWGFVLILGKSLNLSAYLVGFDDDVTTENSMAGIHLGFYP